MKKRNKIISIALLSLLVVGIATASLLTHFGVITSKTTVEQSVLVDGLDVDSGSLSLTDDGGVHTLVNNADVDAVVKLETSCAALVGVDDCEGITTTYVGVLELTKKDTTDWQPLVPEEKIVITYTLVGNTFGYEVVSGEIPSGYELVYAMDKENRFSDYAVVKTVGQINSVGQGLPMEGDWNADCVGGDDNGEYYCNKLNDFEEEYKHCVGAKLWIIPTGDIGTDGILSWINMADYYYETDLMAYSANGLGEITLPANGGGVNFRIVNNFDVALTPDTYTIITNIVPQ